MTFLDWWNVLRSRPEVARAYEALMTQLFVLGRDHRVKSVLLTSPQPGDGKTTVSLNLALTLMHAGKRTLLVDTDLRRPRLHDALELENSLGFSDIVTGCVPFGELEHVQKVVEVVEADPSIRYSLRVITTGKVAPTALGELGSARVREILESLAVRHDFVVLDSPPVLAVSDALVLAPMVDGVLLVFRTGVATEKDARRTKQLVEEAGGRVLGTVMNYFDEDLHGPGVHPYSRSYDR